MNLKSLRSLVQICKRYLEEDLIYQLHRTLGGKACLEHSRKDAGTRGHGATEMSPPPSGGSCSKTLRLSAQCTETDPNVKAYAKELALTILFQFVIPYIVQERTPPALPFSLSPILPVFPSESVIKKVQVRLTEGISASDWRLPGILGWIYQFFVEETEEQIRKGQFYTYPWVGVYLVKQTLQTLWAEIKSERRALKRVKEIKLMDPACGCGNLLIYAFEVFYEMYREEGEIPIGEIPSCILKYNLYGIDTDPLACQLAALNLYLKAMEKSPEAPVDTINIICADTLRHWEAGTEDLPETAYPVWKYVRQICQNPKLSSLIPQPISSLGLQDLKQRTTDPSTISGHRHGQWITDNEPFKELMREVFHQRYDCVVGNPPYLVINQLKTPPELVRVYKQYRSATFKINTFALFLERGVELLAPGGLLSYIVPNTLLTQVYFEALRKYILEKTKILEIVDTKGLFQNAFVENCIISLMQESEDIQRKSHPVQIKTRNTNLPVRIRTQVDLKGLYQAHTIQQAQFYKAPGTMFNIYLKGEDFKLLDKIEEGCQTMGEICESHDGVNPGNVKRKLISTRKTTEHHRKVLNGKDIWRYGLRWGGLYVRYDRSILEPGDNMRWGSKKALDSEKILTRQTADRIIGTFEEGVYYATNTLHTTILRQGVTDMDLKYVLALLNSKLISFYYRKLIPEAGQLFSQVKLIHLRRLPIKKAELSIQKEFAALVDVMLGAFKEWETRDGEQEGFGTLRTQPKVGAGLPLPYGPQTPCSQFLQQVDLLLDQKVYELYGLEEKEIEQVEAISYSNSP